jgi:hypothetical protein
MAESRGLEFRGVSDDAAWDGRGFHREDSALGVGTMVELERSLARRLRRERVGIELPDENTLFFRNVPTNGRYFNKARTNVLIQGTRKHLPYVVGVDEDLEYRGADRELAQAFASAPRRRGWRLLWLERPGFESFDEVVEQALQAIGFEGGEPGLPAVAAPPRPANGKSLLKSFGSDLSYRAASGELDACVGRREEILAILTCLLQHSGRLPVIVAGDGFGKTNLIGALATELARLRPENRLVRIDLGVLFSGTLFDAEREKLLRALLQEAGSEIVVALERLELAFLEAPHGPMLLEEARAEGTKILGTTYPRFVEALTPLHGRLQIVELTELTQAETLQVLETRREALAKHHRVRIPESACAVTVERSKSLVGTWPAKAIDLLDAACACAVLAGAPGVEALHVYLAACRLPEVSPGS